MKKIFLKTYGCQMNEYDSELIRSILQKGGFTFAKDEIEADIILLNTCSVREKANRVVFGLIHKIRHDRGDKPAIYGILGCMATNLKEELINDPHLRIDLIVGPDSYKKLPKLIAKAANEKSFDIELSDTETYEDIYPNRESAANAWIAITRGCNNFCSYCVVPYARGRERSRSPKSIIDEAKHLVKDGFPQITLLGQNVNSYHHEQTDFPNLLKQVCDVEGLKRVWFTSPHPKDVADELINLIAENPKICKHIHLPLQAGNNEILKKMNRPYTKELYLSIVDKLRKKCPDIAITTDIIVGFPTETDEQFQDTVDVFNQVKYDSAFIFKYSPRKLTKAAKDFNDDVSEKVKTERIVFLNDLQQKYALEKNQALVGSTQELLIETVRDNEVEGRTISNKRVVVNKIQDTRHKTQEIKNQNLELKLKNSKNSKNSMNPKNAMNSTNATNSKPLAMGHFINVQITEATPHLLRGTIIYE